MEMFRAIAKVEADVFRRFEVNQLSKAGVAENENGTATQSRAYRALNAFGGKTPSLVL